MKTLKRRLVLGHYIENKRKHSVEITIEVKDKEGRAVLSMCGDVWLPGRRDIIMGGQMQDSIHAMLTIAAYSKESIDKLLAIWDRWHLNDMRAGCEHQRATWNVAKPLQVTIRGKKETKSAGWVTESEHPEGLLSKPCAECGYRYGSQWLYEPLPDSIVDELAAWPESVSCVE